MRCHPSFPSLALAPLASLILAPSSASALTTFSDPSNYQLAPGQFSGVVRLDLNGGTCTGSLLSSGFHILTAAHCLTDKTGALDIDLSNAQAQFNLSSGPFSLGFSNFFLHPDWKGSVFQGNDVAILELASLAPPDADRYDIYQGQNEIGQTFAKVGYGYIGDGLLGEDPFADSSIGLAGLNRFEVGDRFFGSLLDSLYDTQVVPNSQLFFDFDSGLATNDFFGTYSQPISSFTGQPLVNLSDLGWGTDEVNTARGDSGGPAFLLNDLGELAIAGLTSWGDTDLLLADLLRLFDISDIDGLDPLIANPNSSFGEFSSETRISSYAGFINSIVRQSPPDLIPDPTPVPESTSVPGLLLAGIAGSFWAARKSRV